MEKKTNVFKLNEYMKVLEKYQPLCWEEADLAEECRPFDIKNLNGENRKREDYYVDFSDLIAKS